jgi:cytochrome c peroxidase
LQVRARAAVSGTKKETTMETRSNGLKVRSAIRAGKLAANHNIPALLTTLALGTLAIGSGGCGAGTEGSGDETIDEAALAPRSGPFTDLTFDSIGVASTTSPSRLDFTAANPFFHDFGTNGRTCGTCHQEAFGWTITPTFARTRRPDDPLFVFDGSDCLPAGVPNPDPRSHSKAMLSKALVRIDLGIPPTADFTLVSAVDPLGCPIPATAADIRMYRRPLPAANTAFQATIMWDGRENVNPPNNTPALMVANLQHQANDATRGHAQAEADLSDADQGGMVAFETGLFNAQRSVGFLDLAARGGHGGAEFLLENVLPGTFIGINDVFSPEFTSTIFTLYAAWEPGAHPGAPSRQAAAIGRGEALFNGRTFAIDNVRGINSADPADGDPVNGTLTGSCGTCHDTPNIGNHSVSLPIDIGVTTASPVGGLDVAKLPTYTFEQIGTGKTIRVTDPGRGLISGKFKDLGKTKGPTLRALATRAPYFHNGAAKDLRAVVDFYDVRFNIGLTEAEKADLVAFLNAL